MDARNKLLPLSLAFGMAYGAICGSVFGAVLAGSSWDGSLRAFVWQASLTWGFMLGGVGGLVFGLIGARLRGPLGWGMAGAAGGLTATLGLWVLLRGPAPGMRDAWLLLPALIGGGLGLVVGFDVRRGRSFLPGASGLAATVRQADDERSQLSSDQPAEVTPASPTGRGDEVSAHGPVAPATLLPAAAESAAEAVLPEAVAADRFQDQAGWLVFFGSMQVLWGVLAALPLPFVAAELLRPPTEGIVTTTQPERAGWIALAALSAVSWCWLGVGTLRGRRWAWALALAAAWLGLLLGTVAAGIRLLAVVEQVRRVVGPAGGILLRTGLVTGFIASFPVLIHAAIVVAYRNRNVRATFFARDRCPRWTDGCPIQVLVLSLALGYGALRAAMLPVAGAVPFFGRMLTGAPAVAASLALVLAILARETFRRQRRGWWGTVAVVGLASLSCFLTFQQVPLVDFYARSGMTAEQITLLRDTDGWLRLNLPLASLAGGAGALGYLCFIRRYFVPAAPTGRGDGATATEERQ